jgi:hypothetical protein
LSPTLCPKAELSTPVVNDSKDSEPKALFLSPEVWDLKASNPKAWCSFLEVVSVQASSPTTQWLFQEPLKASKAFAPITTEFDELALAPAW